MNNRVALMLFLVFVVNQSNASTINIVNAGFEDPYLDDGWATTNVSGWNVTNIDPNDIGFGSVIENPDSLSFYSSQIEGRNVLMATEGEIVSQSLSDVLEENRKYTFSVDIGRRGFTLDTWDGYLIQLWAGNTLLVQDDTSVIPDERSFLTSNLTYTSISSSAGVGENLTIKLQSYSGVAVVFDNISLEMTSVPAPASIYLLFSGIIGLLFKVKKSSLTKFVD